MYCRFNIFLFSDHQQTSPLLNTKPSVLMSTNVSREQWIRQDSNRWFSGLSLNSIPSTWLTFVLLLRKFKFLGFLYKLLNTVCFRCSSKVSLISKLLRFIDRECPFRDSITNLLILSLHFSKKKLNLSLGLLYALNSFTKE